MLQEKINKVTPYFLSCKRFDLFKQTFESFWENCRDLDLIKSFIIIDDNSGTEDRAKIEKLAKTIELQNIIVYKNNICGQSSSINIAYDLCKTKYAIAIEDDWKFNRSGNFIKKSIDIMSSHNSIKRVCLDFSTSGKKIQNINSEDIFDIDGEKYFFYKNLNKNEWPSFTFRQCVIDLESCKKNVGYASPVPKLSHDNSRPTSETDYGMRYCNHGYRTAFFINSFVEEISQNHASSFDLNTVSRYKENDY